MATIEFKILKPLRYGWNHETKQANIDFIVEGPTDLRLNFQDDFFADLKLAVQLAQTNSTEERKKHGLPLITTDYTVEVIKQEFWTDDINQIAGIRTHFHNGAVQDTPIAKNDLKTVIEQLTNALQRFEHQPQNPSH